MKFILFPLICWLSSGFGSHLTAATFASEYELLRQFPTNLLATLTGGEPDAQGFIGFHKRNSSWYEAGMQRGGCWMLIGAVVAEIAAGSAGAGSGLAYRIAESGYRLNIPRMFAALILLSVAGIVIFFALSLLSHLILRRWHESALAQER